MFRDILQRIYRKKNTIEYWRKKGCTIGKGCEIYSTAFLGGEPYLVCIGDNVRINEGVQLITHDGGVWVVRHLDNKYKDVDVFGKIQIGNNVHIGSNAMIMPNVSIGSNCIIGCGAIVTKNIQSNSVVVGVPGRVIETIDEYIKKNEHRFAHTKTLNKESKKNYLLSDCARDVFKRD